MDLKRIEELYKWMFAFRNPQEIFHDHTSYLAVEILIYVCFALSLKHALRRGGNHLYLFFTILLHGLLVHSIGSSQKIVDVYWPAQSSVMLLGRTLPLHFVCFYPTVIYTSIVSASKARLGGCSQMFSAGVASVVMSVPWHILGVKLLWWTFHDTDPNLADRIYGTPWMALSSFVVGTSSLSFALYFLRRLIIGRDKGNRSGCCYCFKQLVCSILAAILAIPLELLQINLAYHIPHNIFHFPTNIGMCVYFVIFVLFSRIGNVCAKISTRKSKDYEYVARKPDELLLLVFSYFSFFVLAVILAKPEDIFSVGLHQPIGNCNETETLPFTTTMIRNKYLCASNYNEDSFDFHCAMQPTTKWEDKREYIICGTPFPNHNEYIAIITSAALFGMYYFYKLLMKSKKRVLSDKKSD